VDGIPRRTLANSFELDGIGVFTGKPSTMRLIPVEKPDGIIFITGNGSIPLAIENLDETPNRTTLASGSAKIEVVEHLLACLHISGITDLKIECPSGEVPLIDGSSRDIWDSIDSIGTEEIQALINPIVVEKPVVVEMNEAVLIALPYDGFKISYFLAYDDPRIGSEQVSLEMDRETFGSEIAPARSFIESERVEQFVKEGFVKTTDTSQALIVYPDGVRDGFRVEKEFTKHKMLDLVGDLFLAGRPVLGHFIGLRSGHALNHEMIKKMCAI
jgi:UDP-3-O-[3-hydroxymyristoyl] N-acetylglucosamine deacetylase